MMHKTDFVDYADKNAMSARGSESGSIYAQGTIMKRVRGVVHSQLVGLVGSPDQSRHKDASRHKRRFDWKVDVSAKQTAMEPLGGADCFD